MGIFRERIVELLNYLGIFESPEKAWEVSARLRSSPDVAALVKALNGLDPVIREASGMDDMFDPQCERDVDKGTRIMYKAVNMLLIRQMLRMEGEPEENISDGLLRSLYDIAIKQEKYSRNDYLGRKYYKGVYKKAWIEHSCYGKVVEKKIIHFVGKDRMYNFSVDDWTLIAAFHLTVFAERPLQKQAEYLMAFDEEKQTELILSMDKKD